MSTLNDNAFSYSDVLNQYTISTDNISTNNLTITNLTPNRFVGSDSNDRIVTRDLIGSTNQVTVTNNPSNTTLSLPQDIAPISDVSFNSMKLANLNSNALVATDNSGTLINRDLQGTSNQVNINTTGTTTTFSLPQSIATISDVSFNSINLSNLSTNSIVATDSNKTLINRTLQGTTNQVNINTSGTTTTFSLPQDIHTSASPSFNVLNLTGSINQNISGSKGFVIGEIATNTPSGYAGICHKALSDSFTNSCLQVNSGGDVIYNSALNKLLVFAQGGFHKFRVWNNQAPWGYDGQCEVVSTDDYTSNTNSALRVNGGIYCAKKIFVGSSSTLTGSVNLPSLTASKIVLTDGSKNMASSSYGESDIVLTSTNQTIGGNKTFSGTVNMSGLTASKIVLTDASKNVTSSSYGESDIVLTSTNQTIGGTKTFSGTVNMSGLTASKFVVTDASKNLSTSSFDLSEVVTTNTSQTISGAKVFTANPFINNTAQANIRISGSSGIGFSIFSNDDTGGLQFMNLTDGGNLLSLRNTLTASKLLTTDGSNYLSSSSYGVSDLVLTSTNQTVGGNKTFSGTINMSGLTASMYLGLDSSKNIVSVSAPVDRISTTNDWTGVNTFNNSTDFVGDVEIIGAANPNKLVMTNSTKKIVSSSYGESDLALTSTNQTIAGTKTFTTTPSIYNYAVWSVTGSNQAISTASLTKLKWDSSEIQNPLGVTVSGTGNVDFSLPSVGMYLVTYTRKTTGSFTGETDFFVTTDFDSDKYGIIEVVENQLYISVSTMVLVTSLPAKISAAVYCAGANLTLDNSSSTYNRIQICLLSSLGATI